MEAAWGAVSRIPELGRQVDYGIQGIEETGSCLRHVALASGQFGKDAGKLVRKKGKHIEKVTKESQTKANEAFVAVRDTISGQMQLLEEDAKQVEEQIVAALTQITTQSSKAKQDLDTELLQHRKNLDAERDLVKKKRKEAEKEWGLLQDYLKKMLDAKKELKADVDKKKTPKLMKKIAKLEKSILKHLSRTQDYFVTVEDAAKRFNQVQLAHVTEYCALFVDRLKASDVGRSKAVQDVLRRYCQLQRSLYQSMIANIDSLERSIDAVDTEADASAFLQEDPAPERASPPPDMKPQLPCPSTDVTIAISAVLGDYAGDLVDKFNASRGNSVQDATPPPVRRQTGGGAQVLLTALYDYTEDGGAEFMTFREGDVIVLTDNSDETWWGGYKQKDSSKKEQWFPASYVDFAD